MFELKYKITDADMKSVNKSIMWQYFVPYVVAALLGVAAGIAAVTLGPRTEMLVLGIILIVLSAILLVCAILMAIAPKNFVVSALLTDENTERTLEMGENGITIKTPEQPDISVGYNEILHVKAKKTYALLYIEKSVVILVKDEITSGGTFAELIEFLKGEKGNATAEPTVADVKEESETPAAEEPATAEEDTEAVEPENAAEQAEQVEENS